jgi:enoyl-CoA hydratase
MMSKSSIEIKEFTRKTKLTYDQICNLKKPVIAAVNGFALGGGLELALCCDLIIASENAKFSLPEINLGIIPGGGGTQRLPRIVGMARAKELIYSGEFIDAKTALQIGLVNKVVTQNQLITEAKAMAQKFTAKSGAALATAKQSINYGWNTPLSAGLDFEMDCFALCFATEDQKEGMGAFLEKRPPRFRGK